MPPREDITASISALSSTQGLFSNDCYVCAIKMSSWEEQSIICMVALSCEGLYLFLTHSHICVMILRKQGFMVTHQSNMKIVSHFGNPEAQMVVFLKTYRRYQGYTKCFRWLTMSVIQLIKKFVHTCHMDLMKFRNFGFSLKQSRQTNTADI